MTGYDCGTSSGREHLRAMAAAVVTLFGPLRAYDHYRDPPGPPPDYQEYPEPAAMRPLDASGHERPRRPRSREPPMQEAGSGRRDTVARRPSQWLARPSTHSDIYSGNGAG